MHRLTFSFFLIFLFTLATLSGCSSGSSSTTAQSGMVSITGQDAPIPSVLSFVGQTVAVGETVDTMTSPPTLDSRRVVLHRQGIDGHVVSGSIDFNAGAFQLQNNGFWGYVL